MKIPQDTWGKNITEQLQYVGVLSLCQLRKVGYCERVVFDAFMSKYRCLCPKAGKTLDAFVKALGAQGLLESGGWVTGHTKIMLKTEQSNALERALLKVKLRSALVLQRQTKAWLFRKRVKRASDAKAALRGRWRAKVSTISVRQSQGSRTACLRFFTLCLCTAARNPVSHK